MRARSWSLTLMVWGRQLACRRRWSINFSLDQYALASNSPLALELFPILLIGGLSVFETQRICGNKVRAWQVQGRGVPGPQRIVLHRNFVSFLVPEYFRHRWKVCSSYPTLFRVASLSEISMPLKRKERRGALVRAKGALHPKANWTLEGYISINPKRNGLGMLKVWRPS